ncbi:MAG: 23S rRNA (pseudouridine(1915)-N(3))-methyltransferase RlmH [Alphaproteobacteria bacterium]
MRILITAIGRGRNRPETALYEFYAGRINRWPVTLREQDLRRPVAAAKRRSAEAELLCRPIAAGATLIALSENGQSLDSHGFAARLGRWEDAGTSDLAFVIGGADGLDEGLLHRATLVLSLGALTWPHLLARALLAEQLYRAQQILSGHPYHRA